MTGSALQVAKHGLSTYTNQGCRCEVCRAANAAYQKDYRDRLSRKPTELIPHGTSNGYQNYRCRCTDCRAAHADRKPRVKAAS